MLEDWEAVNSLMFVFLNWKIEVALKVKWGFSNNIWNNTLGPFEAESDEHSNHSSWFSLFFA